MEGTRHERAALVGVAYFLGFLTTFIWLGYSSSTAPVTPALTTASVQSASVAAALPMENVTSVEVAEPGVVKYENGVLEISALGGTRTLSFNVEESGLPEDTEFADQGMHVGTLAYATSPTAEYVFFCEQKSLAAETCSPFVYDVLADKIYRVTKDGDRVDLLTSAAKDVTWNENALVVGTEVAKDVAKPWALGN